MSDIQYVETIRGPLTELLAILLYEHDGGDKGWMKLPKEDRDIYRDMADGKRPIGHDQNDR